MPIHTRQCVGCGSVHAVGQCPLKRSGVEHCGMCGLAHFGSGRVCPHLSSETQVRLMLDSLKTSVEPRELVEEARNYLRGVIGDLVRKKQIARSRAILPPTKPPSTLAREPESQGRS